MKFAELLFITGLWLIPMVLLVWVWRLHLSIKTASMISPWRERTALILLSIGAGAWLVFYGLVLLEDHTPTAKAILRMIPTGRTFTIFTLPVCLCALMLSGLIPSATSVGARMRTGLLIGSVYMTLVRIFAMVSLH